MFLMSHPSRTFSCQGSVSKVLSNSKTETMQDFAFRKLPSKSWSAPKEMWLLPKLCMIFRLHYDIYDHLWSVFCPSLFHIQACLQLFPWKTEMANTWFFPWALNHRGSTSSGETMKPQGYLQESSWFSLQLSQIPTDSSHYFCSVPFHSPLDPSNHFHVNSVACQINSNGIQWDALWIEYHISLLGSIPIALDF